MQIVFCWGRRACLPPLACACRSESSTRSPFWSAKSCTDSRRHNLVHSTTSPTYLDADLFIRSSTTNRGNASGQADKTVANQACFPGCQSTDLEVERPARRCDIYRVIVHLPPASQNSFLHKIISIAISWTNCLSVVIDLAAICIT